MHTDDCAEWRELASSLLDGELDEFESARLERHLDACAACTTWVRAAAALSDALHESALVQSGWSFEGSARALRWRFVRVASVSAVAASAAAVAAFVLAQPGSGISLFSAGSPRSFSEAPCVSCTKKQALTWASSVSPTRPQRPPVVDISGSVHTHVTNPLVEPD